MHTLVPPQVAKGTAGIAALQTAVRFLSSVGASVTLQVDKLGRGVWADRAAVWFLTIMGPHMALKMVGVMGGKGTQRA